MKSDPRHHEKLHRFLFCSHMLGPEKQVPPLACSIAIHRKDVALLSRRRSGFLLRVLVCCTPFLVLLRLFRFVRRGVEFAEPVEGFGDTVLDLEERYHDGRRTAVEHCLLTGQHAFVTLQQQWLGLGEFLLAKQGAPEECLRIVQQPCIGFVFLTKG